MLSKQDKLRMVLPRLVKRSLENNVISRRRREKYTNLRWVDMCKWQRVIRGTKEVLVIGLHIVGKMRLDLLILKP
jgi:hypothetical protein